MKKKENEIIKTKKGSLCFWGDWFGRPYDNMHTLVNANIHEKCIELTFDLGEKLVIFDFDEIETNYNNTTIKSANRIWFSYIPYGSNNENPTIIEYTKGNNSVLKNGVEISKIDTNSPALFFG